MEQSRTQYLPVFPKELSFPSLVDFVKEEVPLTVAEIENRFPLSSHQPLLRAQASLTNRQERAKPLKLGVIFSGGPAPGGHNVLVGLLETLKKLHPQSQLIGFLEGPRGLIEGRIKEIQEKELNAYRNQGGFDFLGSGRTKIETDDQLHQSLQVVKKLEIDGVVIVGGDDSNTNAALLSEYFSKQGASTKVIGVPKTIDGDLANPYVPLSFGFDTATKVYSEMIGNLARDAISSRKYYHFVKLMGRSASHVTLECAFATQPNLVFLSEEKKSLKTVVEEIVELVIQRGSQGKYWGIILIPEGLIEFMPDMATLIQELEVKKIEELSSFSKELWNSLPDNIQKQLLLGRDPHGNINVSAVETDVLLINMVTAELKKRNLNFPFAAVAHFFGYEGRCAMPTNFDANYCYTLGMTAALLIARGFTAYMCSVRNLQDSPHHWKVGGVPLTSLMHVELRKKKKTPVIAKSLVDLKGKPYESYQKLKNQWKEQDCYLYPGPIQLFGDPSVTDKIPHILQRAVPARNFTS